jgi:signal transduction histidine kinase
LSREEKETMGIMKEATRFMAETLNDVLSLQKIEEGKLQLEFKPFSPEGLVFSVIRNFR